MGDLFGVSTLCTLPERLNTFGHVGGNRVFRFEHLACETMVTLSQKQSPRGRTYWQAVSPIRGMIAIVDHDTTSLFGCDSVLKVSDISSVESTVNSLQAGLGTWVGPRARKPGQGEPDRDGVVSSWKGKFNLHGEEYECDRLVRMGLRPPQVA